MALLRVGLCNDNGIFAHDPSALRRLDIVVFPELMDGGYARLYAGAAPHDLNDGWVSSFRRYSRRASSLLVAGSTYYRSPARRPTNTSFVFRGGRIIHRYDKIHLFKPCRDHRYFAPGKSVGTFLFTRRGIRLRVGVIICYDLRFPELTRMQASKGMQLLIVPARWPSARDEAWSTLLKARAIENQIFVIGCNAKGREGGASYVFGPAGELLFTDKGKRKQPAVETIVLDLSSLSAARRLHHNISDAVFLPGRTRGRGVRS
ncbi:MAG: carbon-nitrogen family hydrolase [Ignavibacteria bacterium]|nr:carbon-nitrogen family hydrolase [Ignavibacteria bacterium]